MSVSKEKYLAALREMKLGNDALIEQYERDLAELEDVWNVLAPLAHSEESPNLAAAAKFGSVAGEISNKSKAIATMRSVSISYQYRIERLEAGDDA